MATERLRFGRFSFVPATGELRRDDVRVKLQAQPTKVLAALTRNPGQLVPRDALKDGIWGPDTHVDFERGLNFCIAQIRSSLGDSADSPSYVETVPKQGYRFIAKVEASTDDESVLPAVDGSPAVPAPSPWSLRGAAALAAVTSSLTGTRK